jgi:hypothetical protein
LNKQPNQGAEQLHTREGVLCESVEMATMVSSSFSLSTSSPVKARGLPTLSRRSHLVVRASGGKKIKTDKPFGWYLLILSTAIHLLFC